MKGWESRDPEQNDAEKKKDASKKKSLGRKVIHSNYLRETRLKGKNKKEKGRNPGKGETRRGGGRGIPQGARGPS